MVVIDIKTLNSSANKHKDWSNWCKYCNITAKHQSERNWFFYFSYLYLEKWFDKKNFLLSRLRCLQKISYISLELAFLKAFLFWKLPEFRPEWTSSFWWNEMFIPWMQIRNAPPAFQNSQIEIGTFLCIFSTHLLQLGIFAFFLQLPLGKPSKEKNGNILVFYQ